jgi:hypothetical protein
MAFPEIFAPTPAIAPQVGEKCDPGPPCSDQEKICRRIDYRRMMLNKLTRCRSILEPEPNCEGDYPMKYLVSASEGPGFASPEETLKVLEDLVLPLFEVLMRLESEKKILAGGLPLGERGFMFIMEAASNEEADRLLRSLPMWSLFEWDVIALQTFAGRAAQEREFVQRLTKALA